MERLVHGLGLHTVCESALCPNQGECFARGTATFLILGNTCTRNCAFCGVPSGTPGEPDPREPESVAEAAFRLGLKHVVITSVTRDDLADGGASHYVATLRAVRARLPEATVEVLTPDFCGEARAVDLVLSERPEVFNHNVETVPRLYPVVRPQADYERSLHVLRRAAATLGRLAPGGTNSLVKTGLMVGLGEREEEVLEVLSQAAEAGADVVTIGQYLRPSPAHLPVVEYVEPGKFAFYEERGRALGLRVHAGPLVRSSYRAEEDVAQFR